MNNEPNDQFDTHMGAGGGAGAMGGQGEGTQRVKERAQRLASQAQEKAGEQLRSRAEAGKRRAAGTLHDVARSLLDSAEHVDGPASRYVHQAGDQVQRLSDFLESTDVQDMLRRTESFARRQPALFLGSAFFVGVLAARFVKSSRRAADAEREQEYGSALATGGGSGNVAFDRERPLPEYRETGGGYGGGYGAGATPGSYGGGGTSTNAGGATGSGISGGSTGAMGTSGVGSVGGAVNTGGSGGTGTGGTSGGGAFGAFDGSIDDSRAGIGPSDTMGGTGGELGGQSGTTGNLGAGSEATESQGGIGRRGKKGV